MSNLMNKFLSAENKFMPVMHSRLPTFTVMFVDYLLKTKKKYKNLKKQEIQDIFIKTN